MQRSEMAAALLVVILTGSATADAGFPSGRRPYPATHRVTFQDIGKYPKYAFYLYPSGDRITAETGSMLLQIGGRLLAVPDDHPGGNSKYSSTWLEDPKVLRSPVLLEKSRILSAGGPPTVNTSMRVVIAGDQLSCEKVEETLNIPPAPLVSLPLILGVICGGGLFVAVVALAIFVIVVRRVNRKPPESPRAAPPER